LVKQYQFRFYKLIIRQYYYSIMKQELFEKQIFKRQKTIISKILLHSIGKIIYIINTLNSPLNKIIINYIFKLIIIKFNISNFHNNLLLN